MSAQIIQARGPCRHKQHGHCSHHFWQIMQRSGKPGLAEYICLIWRAKMEMLDEYNQAVARAKKFGLSPERRELAGLKTITRQTVLPSCPRFKPRTDIQSSQCRFFFLESCLLSFPLCPGDCDDFLPLGDQR